MREFFGATELPGGGGGGGGSRHHGSAAAGLAHDGAPRRGVLSGEARGGEKDDARGPLRRSVVRRKIEGPRMTTAAAPWRGKKRLKIEGPRMTTAAAPRCGKKGRKIEEPRMTTAAAPWRGKKGRKIEGPRMTTTTAPRRGNARNTEGAPRETHRRGSSARNIEGAPTASIRPQRSLGVVHIFDAQITLEDRRHATISKGCCCDRSRRDAVLFASSFSSPLLPCCSVQKSTPSHRAGTLE